MARALNLPTVSIAQIKPFLVFIQYVFCVGIVVLKSKRYIVYLVANDKRKSEWEAQRNKTVANNTKCQQLSIDSRFICDYNEKTILWLKSAPFSGHRLFAFHWNFVDNEETNPFVSPFVFIVILFFDLFWKIFCCCCLCNCVHFDLFSLFLLFRKWKEKTHKLFSLIFFSQFYFFLSFFLSRFASLFVCTWLFSLYSVNVKLQNETMKWTKKKKKSMWFQLIVAYTSTGGYMMNALSMGI